MSIAILCAVVGLWLAFVVEQLFRPRRPRQRRMPPQGWLPQERWRGESRGW